MLGPGDLRHMVTNLIHPSSIINSLLHHLYSAPGSWKGTESFPWQLRIQVGRHRKICYMNKCCLKEYKQPTRTSEIFTRGCAEVGDISVNISEQARRSHENGSAPPKTGSGWEKLGFAFCSQATVHTIREPAPSQDLAGSALSYGDVVPRVLHLITVKD